MAASRAWMSRTGSPRAPLASVCLEILIVDLCHVVLHGTVMPPSVPQCRCRRGTGPADHRSPGTRSDGSVIPPAVSRNQGSVALGLEEALGVDGRLAPHARRGDG